MSEQVLIEIVAVNQVKKTSKAGKSYMALDLAYKNKSFQDKLEGKQVVEFGDKDVYNTLLAAKGGDVFSITREKENGFWQWIGINKASVGEQQVATSAASSTWAAVANKGNASPKSTYETPEERAAKQVMIVRQSSISSAIALLAANGGKKNTVEEVLTVAKQFEAYVFGKEGGNSCCKDGDAFADIVEDNPFAELSE